MPARSLERIGGVFRRVHEARFGADVDTSDLDPTAFPPALLEQARRTWQQRMGTELRSVQELTRFLEEVIGAGEPYEIHACALDMIEDELRHVGLCEALCRALGAEPLLPEPGPLVKSETYLRAPMSDRALATAISMLLVNETISVAYIADLRDRCTTPAVRRVLDATLGDETVHEEVGTEYVRLALGRYPSSTLRDWRHLVATTLQPHIAHATAVLAGLPAARRSLDAWPDDELVTLGLYSPERQALVFERVRRDVLEPKLRALDL